MKTRFQVLSVVILLLLAPVPGFGLEAVEWTKLVEQMGVNGRINWTDGVIEAVGIGVPPEQYYGKPQARPMALRAAQMDAYRNLLEVTKGVRINSSTTVKDFVVQSDIIMSRVDGLVRGAQVVKRDYMDDGTVEVTVQMALNGSFAHVILPTTIKPEAEMVPIQPPVSLTPPSAPARPQTPPPAAPPVAPPVTHAPPVAPPPTAPPTAPAPAELQSLAGEVYTGMVVDARGLSARPAMSPKILDEGGQEVYGSAFVSREYAVQQGMSGYAKDLSAAQGNQRVTNNPVTVKGLKTEGAGNCDIVISNVDASKIRGAAENLSFLKKCRVMIVVD